MIVYLNGQFVHEQDAVISVFDHGFLYGDGIFEGIKAYDGRIFALDEHVDRFFESAQSIQLTLPLSRMAMKESILETVRRNQLRDAYIRPVASRGKGALGLDPKGCPVATVAIIVVAETGHPESRTDSASPKPIRVISSTIRRNGPSVLSPRVKSTNYLNNILAKLQAHAAGVNDAILLNEQGLVCELTGYNLFVVKQKRVITPPTWIGALDGITRGAVLELASQAGLQTVEEPLTLHDLYIADECFCTATRVEIVPIGWVDGRIIADGSVGPVTAQLMDAFRQMGARSGTPIYPDA